MDVEPQTLMQIVILPPVPPLLSLDPTGSSPPALSACFADDHLLVLDKPAGLLAVPGRGEAGADCLLARALLAWPGLQVVHRLDMSTSGLIVFARHAVAQRELSRAFAARAIDKGYEAVVAGLPPGDEGRIELPLAADWPRRPRQQVDLVHGKPSTTLWRVLRHDAVSRTTRLALVPLTGRTHQLRLHLQAIGHPILGDALYAPPEVRVASPRLLLHATKLDFMHPVLGTRMRLHSPAPF